MTLRTRYGLVVFLLFASAARCAFAQFAATPEVGYNPYKSYSGGDIDHIQMQNGSLYLHIPLLSYPQLGKLKLSFSLHATGPQFEEQATCDNTGDCIFWYTKSLGGPNCGYVDVPAQTTTAASSVQIVVDQDLAVSSCWNEAIEAAFLCDPGDPDPAENPMCYNFNFFTVFDVIDSSEAMHSLGYNQTNWSVLQATDGSGYTVQMPWGNSLNAVTGAEGAPILSPCGNGTVIYESSGVKHTMSSTCNPQNPSSVATSSVTISDPAGNTIQRSSRLGLWTPQTAAITDSVGRQIPDPTLVPDPSLPTLPSGLTLDPDTSACPNLGIPGEPAVYSESWKVPSYQQSSETYHLCYTSVNLLTDFFGDPGQTTSTCAGTYTDTNGESWCTWQTFEDIGGAESVLQSVVLPNKTYWAFKYDTSNSSNQVSYGDLLQVVMPSGGSLNYTYTPINICVVTSGFEAQPVARAVASRTLNPLVGSSVYKGYQYLAGVGGWGGVAHTIETDGEGNDTVHTFNLDYPGSGTCGAQEVSTQWYQGSSSGATGGTVLKEVDTSYSYELNPQDDRTDNFRAHINILPQTQTTLLNGQLVSSDSYNYDTLFTASQPYQTGGDQAITNGIFPTTSPIRYQVPTFVNDGISQTTTNRLGAAKPAYEAAGFVSLPQSIVVADESGVPQSTVTYGYDEAGSPQGLYGNQTSITRDYGIKTTTLYSSFGMPCQTTDANQNTTNYYYDGSTGTCTSGLYVTSVKAPTTNGIQHIRFYQQDYNTGLLTSLTDENASSATDPQHTTFYSYDIVGRLTSVNYPDGGNVTQCYTDTGGQGCGQTAPPYSVLTQRLENATTTIASHMNYDGLGRVINDVAANGASIDTSYDLNGGIASISNPHFTSPSSTHGYTTFNYDALRRKVLECKPDNGTGNGACTPGSSYLRWMYTGSTADSWDENLTQMQHTTDALGRLVKVMELGTATDPRSLETDYTYDTLGNLKYVNQHGTTAEIPRTRSFTYDSLSRLLTSQNPETGTICYGQLSGSSCTGGYDANGNLLYKTDANGMTVAYTYDALNRMLTKTAPDGGYTRATFNYDQGSNGIGRLSAVGASNNASGTKFTYDPMGRITNTQWYDFKHTAWQTGMGVLYDLAANITQLTYPDGRVVNQTWSSAGRLLSVADGPLNGGGAPYVNGLLYLPSGSMTASTYGNGVTQSVLENSRLQPCHAMASTPLLPAITGGGNLLDRESFYSTGSPSNCGLETHNNGNIASIVDNRQVGMTQSFAYDGLNRLRSAARSDGAYNHTYNIDSFGNMMLHDNLHTTPNYSIDPATSRLMLNGTDFQYNAGGELISAPNPLGGSHSMAYTAEGYLDSIDTWQTGSYIYNGLGERTVASRGPGSTSWNEYVYLNGQPMADVDNTGMWSDYIYANGQKIAKVDSVETRIHTAGTYAASGDVSTWVLPNLPANYPIKPHDKLMWKQYQTGIAGGGINLIINNYTTWLNYGVPDTDGLPMNHGGFSNQWHPRVVDLNAYAGSTISAAQITSDTYLGAGTWSVWYKDIVIVSPDGTVTPLYTGQTSVAMQYWTSDNPANESQTVDIATTSPSGGPLSPSDTTTYFLDDNLGTTQMELSAGGWPLWQGQFTPYGQELPTNNYIGQQPADGTSMRYKFTGKERDAESGLDYFGARYYGSNLGRFTSPDWAAKAQPVPYAKLGDPQTLNLYVYVGNNPLSRIDFDGHCADHYKDGSCKVNVDPTTGKAGALAGKQLEGILNKYDKAVNALDDKGKFNIKDKDGKVIGSMTGQEMKAVWNGTSFTVTNNKDFQNGGGGGGTAGNWNGNSFSGHSELNAELIKSYGNSAGQAFNEPWRVGFTTLIFHELSHETRFGEALTRQYPVTRDLAWPRELGTSSAGSRWSSAVGASFDCRIPGGCQ